MLALQGFTQQLVYMHAWAGLRALLEGLDLG